MKTGKPTRLSEKLNAELDSIRQEYAASMASQLESFRSDLTAIASDAQRTIESDTRCFQKETANLFQTRLNSIRRCLTISPFLISVLILALIASMMVASYFWTLVLKRSELMEIGLTHIVQAGQTWLVLDPSRGELNNCVVAGRSTHCIKILEQ